MSNVFKESWNESVTELEKMLPPDFKEKLKRNKIKVIATIVALLSIELLVLFGVFDVFFSNDTNTTNIKKG